MSGSAIPWWESLKHGGMLIAPARLPAAFPNTPDTLPFSIAERLRREIVRAQGDGHTDLGDLLDVVLESVCGFTSGWFKGSGVGSEWSTRAPSGENVKPRRVWQTDRGGVLPVFVDDQPRLGVGRGRRSVARVLEWLRARGLHLALLTNGRQWRLIYAGADHDAFCEWDTDLWFAEGQPGPQVEALRRLLSPEVWDSPAVGAACPLLQVILDSRKGQSDLSAVLGERVRQAVEHLIRAHGPALDRLGDSVPPRDIYAAAVRVVMRMVVTFFAESRLLLPLDSSPLYYASYSLSGLREELEREHARAPGRLAHRRSAWPRVLALFTLIREGCGHPDMAVPRYGGDLFERGSADARDGLRRALAVFESACFSSDFDGLMSDADVRDILERLSYSEVKVRQGRGFIRTRVPVDFSDLQSEYIGILYEGLLDFELRRAGPDEPIVFLAIGDEPALPLSRLEAMTDPAIKNLVEKMKKPSRDEAEDEEEEDAEPGEDEAEDTEEEPEEEVAEPEAGAPAVEDADTDPAQQARRRAHAWARRAVTVGGLVARPRSRRPEALAEHARQIDLAARRLVRAAVLPGQWYLVRWGGTRKGAGTFYTKPQLAVPTVHRTLRPLAFDPPQRPGGTPDHDAPTALWTPRKPEQILSLKVCDPAVGSGSFPVAALRFLTDALYRALEHHGRLREEGNRTLIALAEGRESAGRLDEDHLPCRPTDAEFEPRLKARLRRYIVERCLYGVDLDPLAVELARIALWIETMDRELPFSFLKHKFKEGNSLVGCWFDRFRHYPIMAWEREGGDSGHTTGVHFQKEARTKAIRRFKADVVRPDLIAFIDRLRGQGELFTTPEGKTPEQVHDDALALLEQVHHLPPGEDGEHQRAELHRQLRESPSFKALKRAFDAWCALWFWPVDQLALAPLPSTFAALTPDAAATVDRLADERRFFHWELEFPDVFAARAGGDGGFGGFHAILGNPPWDIAKPNSKEFFSSIDPLYRTYGKQEALARQKVYFDGSAEDEERWLDYTAYFKAMSNWIDAAGFPFGDRVMVKTDRDGTTKQSHKFPLGDRGRNSFASSTARHAAWARRRAGDAAYADPEHSFRHQGSADINLYKCFLEQAHALLAHGGRLGFVLPSGIYTDHGTTPLRRLLLDRCRWEWLFGFENRLGIFDIDSRFKFNPVIVVKGGRTESIHTAFMRHDVDDWELGRAESLAVPYARAQVERFSPRSRAILEIRSDRDLEVLEKIYASSVLLGDDGPGGWGITYAREFDMTNDSHLFPPRPKWEEWRYKPDEYSRWLKGRWRPVSDLWDELGVSRERRAPFRGRPSPRALAAAERLGVPLPLDDRGEMLLNPPPYQSLPLPRADIPAGIVLSRDCTEWMREDEIEWEVETVEDKEGNEVEVRHRAVALPLYQGLMFYDLSPNVARHVRGAGHNAEWAPVPSPDDPIEPQFLLRRDRHKAETRTRIGFRALSNATNERTIVACLLGPVPCGNSVGILWMAQQAHHAFGAGVMGSLSYDYVLRSRIAGTNINAFFLWETGWPTAGMVADVVGALTKRLCTPSQRDGIEWVGHGETACPPWRTLWALTPHERLRLRCILDAVVAAVYDLDEDDLKWILKDCDHPVERVTNKAFARTLDPKGFWRVDKAEPPERRHTVLTLVAFHDLQRHIGAAGGDRDAGMRAFLDQNDGEGWMIPEELRLADYGLGHDDRACQPQPVAAAAGGLGPRFYDWQLVQEPDESWRECELHARNLLGAEGFGRLTAQSESGSTAQAPEISAPTKHDGKDSATSRQEQQSVLFE